MHLPWCLRKCPYCDFNSHALKNELPERAYVEALLLDLTCEAEKCEGREIQSIFIGGGTPSLFSPESNHRLLDGVRVRLALSPTVEVTLEANPGAADQARFAGYRAAGVNRLSIGVQSFDDELLKRLGRVHDSRAAIGAAEAATAAGFENFNLDLMYALPGQSPAQAERDLRTALALHPVHLSYYQLTLEPNTEFHHRPPILPAEEDVEAIETRARSILAASGYTQYEVSAYAQGGRTCRHNLNYWRFGDYLGIGAGAHGKLTDSATGRVMRCSKERHPVQYMEKLHCGDATQERRDLRGPTLLFEFMLNALRLTAGFEPALFRRHTGLEWQLATPVTMQAEQDGLLTVSNDVVMPTALGKRFLNDLVLRFLPKDDVRPD
jgi:putative oxygen-independent coproporphyrinogen III oxidase